MTKNTQSCSITLRFKVFWQRKVQPSGSGGFEPLIQGDVYKRQPYDNLVLAVTLKADGSTDKRVLGSLTEAIKAQSNDASQWNRLKEIFVNPGLQMISFTITEKGYALKGADGSYFPFIQADIDNGPDKAGSAMAVVCALLYERYKAGKYPLAVV